MSLAPLVLFGGSSTASLVAVWLLTEQPTGVGSAWWLTVVVLTVATIAVVMTGTRLVDDRPDELAGATPEPTCAGGESGTGSAQ